MIELYDGTFSVTLIGSLEELAIRLESALEDARDALALANTADWPAVDDERPHLYAVPA